MGKNLKGKECGKEICQENDGVCIARFVNALKMFPTIPETCNRLEKAKYEDKHINVFVSADMTEASLVGAVKQFESCFGKNGEVTAYKSVKSS